jgi:hypothetical protein
MALSPPAQTQTIEAQASIGAVEQASVSAEAPAVPVSPGSDETTDSAATTETAAPQTENRIYPRISPPSTGEPVPAARYGANGQADAAQDSSIAAEANIAAEPAPDSPGPAAAGSSSEQTPTETLSQHG